MRGARVMPHDLKLWTDLVAVPGSRLPPDLG